MKKTLFAISALVVGFAITTFGQESKPKLHVNPRWRECSFQLDKSLTQDALKVFAREAGAVAYFRPLTDAKALGKKHFEFSILQTNTKIDPSKPAWNDTFVHPDSTHWLIEGPRLPIPGFAARVGITDRLDVGAYFTKAIGANYGFWSVQAQYNLIENETKNWSAAARASFTSLYGPDDLGFSIYGADILVSREFVLHERWARIAPYAGVSSYLSSAREKSAVVDLNSGNVLCAQAMVGIVAKVAKARIGIEYNLASVNTVSYKIGLGF